MSKSVSIVIPVLNEEENLPLLYERLRAVFESRAERMELVFVDDGSTDGGVIYLSGLCEQGAPVQVIEFTRNFGHQAAITAGLDYATGDAVVIMDADLQDPPEVIPDLLDAWASGCEVVYAVRRTREGETFIKKFFAASFYRLFHSMCSVEVPVDAGDFRLLDRKVVDVLKRLRETHRYLRAMTSWVGFRQGAVEYDRAARNAGETKYPLWRSLKLALDGLTSFSAKPLQWMMSLGLFVSAAAALYALWVVYMKMSGDETLVPGWASLAILVLFLGGVQLVALGLLGQYMSRVFDEAKNRPLYVVRPSVQGETHEA